MVRTSGEALSSSAITGDVVAMAPCAPGTVVPRYDCFFLRTASFDVPSEGKSAFAQEMEDLEVMTSEYGGLPRSTDLYLWAAALKMSINAVQARIATQAAEVNSRAP